MFKKFSRLFLSALFLILASNPSLLAQEAGRFNLVPKAYADTTMVAQDNFQRANQTFWGSASDGQSWTSDASSNNAFSINNNAGLVTNTAGSSYNAILGPVISDSEVLFTGSLSSYSNSNMGAVLRWQDSNNWYKAYIDGTNLVLQKKISGSATILGTTPFTAVASTNYSLRFQVVGNTLDAKVWQTNQTESSNWMLSSTDSFLASGHIGLRTLTQGGTAIYTSFTGTNLSSTQTNPTPTFSLNPTPTPNPSSASDYSIASGADPWGTAFDSIGNVWVAVPGCDPGPDCASGTPPGKIEVFNPATKTWLSTYQLPPGYGQPLFLAFDSTGNLWFPMFHTNALGQFNPVTQSFQQWSVPTPNSGPWDVAVDHNGKIWFTEHYVNQIGRFDPVTQTFLEIPTPATNSQPYGITVDSSNNMWFTENNPSVALIAQYTAGGQLLEYKIRNTLPSNNLTPHLITADPSGNIWWSEGWVSMIGKLNVSLASPGTNNGVTEYAYPRLCFICGTHTSGISVDSNGLVWFDDSLQSEFGSFSPSTQQFNIYNTPTNNSHPHDGMNVDKNNNIWFDEEFAGKLAMFTQTSNPIPSPTPTPTPIAAQIAQDTFNRSNQSGWGTASDGQIWGADANSLTNFSINNNAGQVSGSSGIINATLGPSQTDSQVLASVSANSLSGTDFGVLLHFTDTNNWYKAYIDGSNLIIRRMLAGNNIVLNQTSFTTNPNTSYTIKFQILGSSLSAKAWPSSSNEPSIWMLTTTDSNLTSGQAGVGIANPGGNNVSFTSFTAYSLSMASTTPTPTATPTPTSAPQPTAASTPTPVPGTIAQDSFIRPNQTGWGTSSDGHNWGSDAATNSVFSILGNTGQVKNTTTSYSATLGTTATDAQVLSTGSLSNYSSNNIGSVLRFTDSNNWYKAYIDGTSLVLQKKIAGSATILKSIPFTASANTNYSIRFQVVGTTLSAKVWQTGQTEPSNWMATATDSFLNSGLCGLRMQAINATTTYTSFLATAL